WTADEFWDIMNDLPEQDDGTPSMLLALSVYSDKSQLSSFGTVKVYPVILHVLNIHNNIRNTTGFGGGHLIGLLPHVEERAEDKFDLASYRRNLIHSSFAEVFESLRTPSKVVTRLQCGDGKEHHIYFYIKDAVADGEEQTMLTGTLGPNANYPCPRCKVHTSQLSSLTVKWPVRTSEDSHSIIESAQSANTKKQAAEILSSAGLAGVWV
ncbi:uncharacterized protein EI90DRAFT_2936239, partial [Cantharellus anzutake]|uniref:uncharacterized protein n=1 Tax=Cantharellus anzutake TaxID=1750568 RepID=UPI001904E399